MLRRSLRQGLLQGSLTVLVFAIAVARCAIALPSGSDQAQALGTHARARTPTSVAAARPSTTKKAVAKPTRGHKSTSSTVTTATSSTTTTAPSTTTTSGTPITPPMQPSSFIARQGTGLSLNGQPYKFVGYNVPWIAPSCGGSDSSWFDITYPDLTTHSKANLVRAVAAQVFRNGSLDFSAFDTYVASAKKYGLRIVPALTDNWGQCGDGNGEKYLPWWQTGYVLPESASQPLSYQQYAVAFAKHYANEPTIAWYQLANEPDARNRDGSCSATAAASALRTFADTMTDAIKLVDPNHMVDLGAISWCGGEGADYGYVNAGKVDLCDIHHDYKATVAMPSTEQSRINQCLVIDDKPGFIGESGICASVDASGNCTGATSAASLQNRANDFGAKMNAGFQAGLSGYVIWQAAHGCSGSNSSWDIGASNANPSYNCAVAGPDPMEAVMAGFAS
ncbi:MAG: mannan endo,4-beta-mannosidase [Actinomycetota bacterium]|nr:mannan endo,4-beta-mannosidase [Actinomycetota bacterium]